MRKIIYKIYSILKCTVVQEKDKIFAKKDCIDRMQSFSKR